VGKGEMEGWGVGRVKAYINGGSLYILYNVG